MATNVRKYPDGEIHTGVNFWIADFLLVAISAFCIFYLKINSTQVFPKIIWVWLGIKIASLYVSPDLDLVYCTAKRNWKSFGWIWTPYTRFIAKRHRGTLSHGIEVPYSLRRHRVRSFLFRCFGFLLGSIARTLYLLVIAGMLALIGNITFGTTLFSDGLIRFLVSEAALYLFMGVCIADFLHTRLDKLGNKKSL